VGASLTAFQCGVLHDPDGLSGKRTLRALPTDKPYFFDMTEEAIVTITRVEVRREEGAVDCLADVDCGDGVLCNGTGRSILSYRIPHLSRLKPPAFPLHWHRWCVFRYNSRR